MHVHMYVHSVSLTQCHISLLLGTMFQYNLKTHVIPSSHCGLYSTSGVPCIKSQVKHNPRENEYFMHVHE